jgi:hypothetical protein
MRPEAEFTISQADVARLIASRFPELSPLTLRVLGEGWDNVAWLVNDEFVFRMPRRQMGATAWRAKSRSCHILPNTCRYPFRNPSSLVSPPTDFRGPTPVIVSSKELHSTSSGSTLQRGSPWRGLSAKCCGPCTASRSTKFAVGELRATCWDE